MVTCSEAGPLASAASSTFVVGATSSSGLPAGGNADERSVCRSGGTGSEFGEQPNVVITDFSRSSDLTVMKVDAADPVIAGEPLTYTITASNAGPSVAANAVVTETLPAGVVYDDALSDARCNETPSAGSGVVTCGLERCWLARATLNRSTYVATLSDGLASGAQLDNSSP